MRLRPITSLALVSSLALLGACTADVGTDDENSSTGMVSSMAYSDDTSSVTVSGVTGLGDELRERGLTVSAATALSGETLFPEATNSSTITVNGQSIQVFEFSDVEEAQDEADAVSANGNMVHDETISWVGTPRFYRSGSVIILYLGNNPAIMTPLQEITGGPFAGTGMGTPAGGTGATL